jgi:hypothetical protein
VSAYIQHSKTQKGPERIPLVIEAVILACLQNSEQQESTEPRAPYYHEDRHNDIARIASIPAETESKDGEKHRIAATSEVGQFIELQRKRDGEEESW